MLDVAVYRENGCSNENTIQLLFTIFINPFIKPLIKIFQYNISITDSASLTNCGICVTVIASTASKIRMLRFFLQNHKMASCLGVQGHGQ